MARFKPRFKETPFRYRPVSSADINPDDMSKGAMAALTNLVPNPTSEDQWVCRPGAFLLPGSDMNTAVAFYKPVSGNNPLGFAISARLVIDTTLLAAVAGGGMVYVGFRTGPSAFGMIINSAWIGEQGAGNPYNFDGNQKQLTFDGGNTSKMNITGQQYFNSDLMSGFSYTNAKKLIISYTIYFGTGTPYVARYNQAGLNTYYQNASNNVPDVAGQTAPAGAFVTVANADLFIAWVAFEYASPSSFVSSLKVIGNRAYGTVADLSNPGYDVPFVYDLITQQQITVSGIVKSGGSINVPTSPLTLGAWQPPIIDSIGAFVIVCHPGFSGATNGYFGWFDLTTFSAPSWHSGNTATNALPTPPVSVKNFNNRAWYVVRQTNTPDTLYVSDNVPATTGFRTISFPVQILTAGNYLDEFQINALEVLGLHNILGGITHALLIFKSNNVFQVTGDFGSNSIGSLLINSLNVSVGTQAPLGVAATPRGVAFLSADGYRIIDWDGKISDPIGEAGGGVVQPFTQAVVPSRVVAACNGQCIRISTQNNAVRGQPNQEWVFDLELKKWHGPHTFPFSLIDSWNITFIGSPLNFGGLWQSDIIPSTNSQFTENGLPVNWTFQTSLIPNSDSTNELSMVETTIYVAGGIQLKPFVVTASSAQGTVIDTTTINPPITGNATFSIWGTFVWGRDAWFSSGQAFLNHVQIPWNRPIVSDRLQITIQGQSDQTVTLGELRMLVEETDYIAVPG
jgi:hypothetical protein